MPNQPATSLNPAGSKLKPPPLQRGDAIGIIAPASNINRDLFETGRRTLEARGYRVLFNESIFERDLYFAGSAARRTRELEDMFRNPDVRAIICVRGGYGSNYLLAELNLDVVRQNPKIFMAYSDITCLLTYFTDAAGLITFHGPMLTKDIASPTGVDWDSFEAATGGAASWDVRFTPDSGIQTLVPGTAEGVLYGGCLSILVASLGTPYEIRTAGSVLFLEDVNAKPFQIDRMLMQMKLAGKLEGVRGIIFGEMLDCRQSPTQDYSLEEVILRIVSKLNIPVIYGVRSGHVSGGNITLPLGVRVRLAADKKQASISFVESATEPLRAARQV
jgi:muramoyltetrapeptide carboxypeptidase